MKNLLLVISIFGIFSCSEKIPEELNGNWVIAEIKYNGKEVYPETISKKFEITFNVNGFENAEQIQFINSEKAAILPGFQSEKITVDFVKNSEQIEFKLHKGIGYDFDEFELTKKVFLHNYKLSLGETKGELILKSDSTTIKMMNQKVLIENEVDKVFDRL